MLDNINVQLELRTIILQYIQTHATRVLLPIYIRSTRYSTRNTDPSDGPHRTCVNILTDTSSHRTDDVCSVCTPAIVYGRAPEPELVLGRCD